MIKIVVLGILISCAASKVQAQSDVLWHHDLSTLSGAVRQLAISSNGSVCLVLTNNCIAFRGSDGSLIHDFGSTPGAGCAISPDGSKVAFETDSARIELADTNGNIIATLSGHRLVEGRGISSIDWSRDGKYIVSGGYDTTVRIWDVASQTLLRSIGPFHYEISTYDEISVNVNISPENDKISIGHGDYDFWIYSFAGDSLFHVNLWGRGPYHSVPFSDDGRYVLANGDLVDIIEDTVPHTPPLNGTIRNTMQQDFLDGSLRAITVWNPNSNGPGIYSLTSGKLLYSLYGPWDSLQQNMAVSTDGRYALTGGGFGGITMWNLSQYAKVNSAQVNAAPPLEAYADHGRVTLTPPSERGSAYVYRTDGRCFYSSQVQVGIPSYSTGPLPAGVYFVVFQSESGERRFAKVSLFE